MTEKFSADFPPLTPFESSPVLAVAVSGGADSMALLFLAHEWAKERGGRAVALTVDHGLRAESASEAAQVKRWCEKEGIEHHTLHASHPLKKGSIQAAARTLRYALLTDWCRAHHVLHLLTAHHQGDQAETLFFRLMRGSGFDGLAAMPAVSSLRGIRLLRPLLAFSKSELIEYLQKRGQGWIEDPSNDSSDYTRNILRRAMHGGPATLIHDAAALAGRFAAIRRRFEQETAAHLARSCFIYPEGYGRIAAEKFRQLPDEYAARVLAAVIRTLSGSEYAPRGDALARLCTILRSGKNGALGGLIFRLQPKTPYYLVYREPEALQDALPLTPGEKTRWDHRFEVGCARPGITVRALGQDGRRQLTSAAARLPRLPGPVMASLPSFWNLEKLVAVPHMKWRNPALPAADCRARFIPAKALAGAAFFSLNVPIAAHAHTPTNT